MNNEEIWKDIANYEGLYEVSNLGNIRSLNYNKTGKVQVLKPGTSCGYLYVNLSKDGKTKGFKVHRLVAMAFIPNPNNLPEVNHKDENKQNNRVDNLEWCTHKYNNNYGTKNERASKALKGKTLSEEHRAKLGKAKKGNQYSAKKVICLELKRIFDSAREASEYFQITDASHNIRKGYKTKGYTLKYIEIIEIL